MVLFLCVLKSFTVHGNLIILTVVGSRAADPPSLHLDLLGPGDDSVGAAID